MWILASCSGAGRINSSEIELIVFLAPDCPISLYYIPELRKIHETWGHQVKMTGIIPGTAASGEECRQFKDQHPLPFDVIHDPQMEYVNYWGAEVTPEVMLVDGGGQILYRGAIDDALPELGVKRSVVGRRYLRENLLALKEKRPLPYTQIPAVGCFIEFD